MTLRDLWLQFTHKIFPRYKNTLLALAVALFVWVIWLNSYLSRAWDWDAEETLLLFGLAVGYWVTAFLCVVMLPVFLALTRQFVSSKAGLVVGSEVISLFLALLGFATIALLVRGMPFEWDAVTGVLLSPLTLLAEIPTLGVVAYVASSASTTLDPS